MPSKRDCPVEVSELRPFSTVSVGSEAFSHFCMRHRPEALTKQFDLLKHLPAMQETRVQSLGWEDPLEKEMATHSSTLAWKIPWSEEPHRLQSMGSQRVQHDWAMTHVCSCHKAFLNCTRYVHHGCRRSCNSQKNERNFECLVSETTYKTLEWEATGC